MLALAAALLLTAGCASSSLPIPPEWTSVPTTAHIAAISLSDDGTVTPSAGRSVLRVADGPIRVVTNGGGSALMSGEKLLAEGLGAIDSFDFSESRGEVAFSAKHEKGFDIALISSDGGPVHWIPNADPSDEVAVQWAPRGNKISYVLRTAGGDVVRTLHIPTAYQFAISFPGAVIHDLAWDPKAEHYAVAYSTADSSDRVEVLEYDGEKRRTAIPPERQLDVDVAPLVPGAILLQPRDIRYGEKIPCVVWMADDLSWNDARGALVAGARVAVVVTTRVPDAELWRAAAGIVWLDSSRPFVVGAVGTSETRSNAIVIAADPSLEAGRYVRRGNVVAVPPPVVQSFAAGFIAAQVKRTTPTNGSSR